MTEITIVFCDSCSPQMDLSNRSGMAMCNKEKAILSYGWLELADKRLLCPSCKQAYLEKERSRAGT